jgi:ATP-dependent DNA helicase PIF1
MLNEMREGRLAQSSISKFRSLSRELHFDDDLEATELFATRQEVERANQMRLAQLDGETRIFEARDGGSISEKEFRDKLLANVMAPERIALKPGSQVMLIKNYDDTLVNGSLGKVIGFMSETEFTSYHDDEEAYLSTQAPRRNTGQTIVDLAGASSKYPVVRFAISDGTTRDMLCHREQWSVELPSGEVQASRSQVPLILAWALSIHKAQGQTLERVKVNLSRAFERGQAYVALSRATSMAGLQVIGFDPKKVMAHEAVRKFYAGLSHMIDPKPLETAQTMPGAYPKDEVIQESRTSSMPVTYAKQGQKQQSRTSSMPGPYTKQEKPKTTTPMHEDDDAFWDSQFPDDDF